MNKLNNRFQPLFTIVMFLLLVTLLELLGLPRRVRNSSYFLSLKLGSQAKLSQLTAPLSLVDRHFQRQLDEVWLEKAYLHAQAELHRLGDLEKENQALRQQLNVKGSSQTGRLVARPVYSQSPALVAVGSADGVKPGSLVFAQDVLLGVLNQVEPHVSSVRLLSQDPNLKLLAKTESGVTGLVSLVGGQLSLSEIPANLTIELNSSVFTLGQPGIPPGLLLGLTASQPEKDAYATYAVKLDQGTSFYEQSVVNILP